MDKFWMKYLQILQKVLNIFSNKFPKFPQKIHANKPTMSLNIPDLKELKQQIFGNFP